MKDAYGQEIEIGSVIAWGAHSHSGSVTLGWVEKFTPSGLHAKSLWFSTSYEYDDDGRNVVALTFGYRVSGATLRSAKNVVVTGYTKEDLFRRFKPEQQVRVPISYESKYEDGDWQGQWKPNWREIQEENDLRSNEALETARRELGVPFPERDC